MKGGIVKRVHLLTCVNAERERESIWFKETSLHMFKLLNSITRISHIADNTVHRVLEKKPVLFVGHHTFCFNLKLDMHRFWFV